MKTQYYTATTLDGFIADENNSLDWCCMPIAHSDLVLLVGRMKRAAMKAIKSGRCR